MDPDGNRLQLLFGINLGCQATDYKHSWIHAHTKHTENS